MTDEQVAAIYDLEKYGPTAMDNQPLRIVLVREGEARERLLKVMADGNRDKTANAPLVAVLAADTDFHEHLHRTFPHFTGAKDAFADPAAREEAARFNATLQIGYFLIGVRAAGLAAGPMGGFDADAWYDRIPRLDQSEVVLEA